MFRHQLEVLRTMTFDQVVIWLILEGNYKTKTLIIHLPIVVPDSLGFCARMRCILEGLQSREAYISQNGWVNRRHILTPIKS